MRQVTSLKAALLCGALSVLGMTAMSHGQTVVNGGFESPVDTADSTSTTADGWTMDADLNADGTTGNAGQRASFFGSADPGRWSFWIQAFQASGDAYQDITSGVTAGTNYTFADDMFFQTTSPTTGYNAVVGLNSYLEMQFLNSHGLNLGAPVFTNIPAGAVTGNTWLPYSVTGVAPSGATGVRLEIGWTGGGSDNNTGSQSAGADAVTFGVAPEPASLSLLGVGALSLLARRRAR
jgi:hypothetical protein